MLILIRFFKIIIIILFIQNKILSAQDKIPVKLAYSVLEDLPMICSLKVNCIYDNKDCLQMLSYRCSETRQLHLNSTKGIGIWAFTLHEIMLIEKYQYIILEVRLLGSTDVNANGGYYYRLKGFRLNDFHHFSKGLMNLIKNKKEREQVYSLLTSHIDFISPADWSCLWKSSLRSKNSTNCFIANAYLYWELFGSGTLPKSIYANQPFDLYASRSKYPYYWFQN